MDELETRVVEFAPNIAVTVSASNGLIGAKRSRLKQEALAETDVDRRFLRFVSYADVVAATPAGQGFEQWPLTFDAYADLPEAWLIAWEAAVYALNPHWLPAPPANAEDAEKKETRS